MIVDFTVENYKSIKEEQTLSLAASNAKDELPGNLFQLERDKNISLLKTCAIYGANASGKSNLVSALKDMIHFVVNSTDLKLGEAIPVYRPYKLDTNRLWQSSKFELEFVGFDRVRYRYKIVFDREEVLVEELVFYPHKQEARLFFREKGKEIKFGSHFKGRKKNIESELIPNNLFLSKAANSNHEQLKDIYLYFLKRFTFLTRAYSMPAALSLSRTLALQREGADRLKDRLRHFLVAADTGIHSVGLERNGGNGDAQLELPENLPESRRQQVLSNLAHRPITYHKLYDGEKEIGTVRFDLEEESNGTIKMYDLAGTILSALESGGTVVVDELDSSLHPYLSEYVLDLFNEPVTNPNNAQFIAATHDASLLNPKHLRRDQIWFVEKNRFGATELFSLDEFNKNEVRKTTPFDKWYLDGRFGAVPRIDRKLFETGSGKEQD